jgi:hypothetical protein
MADKTTAQRESWWVLQAQVALGEYFNRAIGRVLKAVELLPK